MVMEYKKLGSPQTGKLSSKMAGNYKSNDKRYMLVTCTYFFALSTSIVRRYSEDLILVNVLFIKSASDEECVHFIVKETENVIGNKMKKCIFLSMVTREYSEKNPSASLQESNLRPSD